MATANPNASALQYLKTQIGNSVSDVSYIGSTEAITFVNAFRIAGALAPTAGFLMSSGDFPDTINDEPSHSVDLGMPGDDDLSDTAFAAFSGAGATQDASTLSFKVNVTSSKINGISFDMIFGSDEFPEYSDSTFVDIAAIYVNGVNVALFNNDPLAPLSILQPNIDAGYFRDNTAGVYGTEWDGFSNLLAVRAALKVGVNTIKIGVADTGDSIYDSGLFIGDIHLLSGQGGQGVLNVVRGSFGDNNIAATAVADEINLLGGADTVHGTAEELNNDVITGFRADDILRVEGASFVEDDVTLTASSGVLKIDTDQDDIDDLTIALDGNFTGGALKVTAGTNATDISFTLPDASAIPDFDGDGISEMLWRKDSGSVTAWRTDGFSVGAQAPFAQVIGAAWDFKGVADFDGDGKDDILWQHDNGTVAVWKVAGAVVTAAGSPGGVGPAWELEGTGDFNGDGKADILWHNDNGSSVIWQMDFDKRVSSGVLPTLGQAWQIDAVGDFNGDGKADIVWNHDDGRIAIWLMNGAKAVSTALVGQVGPAWELKDVADFDGDGRDEFFWRSDKGTVAIWGVTGSAHTETTLLPSVGTLWDQVGTGDYNADGQHDLLWRHDDGRVAIWQLNDSELINAETVGSAGLAWDLLA